MVTDDDYRQATHPAPVDSLKKAVQKAVQSATAVNYRQPSPENEEAVSPACANDTASGVPPRGVEPRFSD